MSYSKREREDYNRHREHVTRELGIDKNKYNALRRVAQHLHRADEDYAMGRSDWRHEKNYNPHSPRYEEKEHGKDVAHAFKKAEAIRKKLGGKHAVHFYHQGDPRGAALYVAKHRMKHTDYNKGHVIY